jgi:hypothetical protein
MVKIFLSLIAIASLGGLFTVASSSAVPGNVLYPFKISVCESIGKLFSISDTSRGDFALSVAQQRLLELQIVTQDKTVTPQVQADLLAGFDKETDTVKDAIIVLQAEEKFTEASALAAKYAAMMSQQIAVFTALKSPFVDHLQTSLETVGAMVMLQVKRSQ